MDELGVLDLQLLHVDQVEVRSLANLDRATIVQPLVVVGNLVSTSEEKCAIGIRDRESGALTNM